MNSIIASFTLLTALFANVSHAQGSVGHVELNSSVMLFHEWDYQSCARQVEKAHLLGSKKVNFVATAYYSTNPNFTVDHYCYSTSASRCTPISETLIQQLTDNLTACFQRVADLGMDISVLPHLDWGSGSETWRNNVIFDPLLKHGAWSYKEILIDPLMNALIRSVKPPTKVEFALQGEMGATVFAFPASYRALLTWARRTTRRTFSAQIGISLNFNKINGGVTPLPEDLSELQGLINEVKFIGISAYNSVSVKPVAADFIKPVQFMVQQLESFGLKVPSVREFHFSEMGLGGGTPANDGKTAAPNPLVAASCPWSGIRSGYTIANDPWTNLDNRELRRQYHRALVEFLKTQPAKWKVTSAFLWNTGSWDPQGLYGMGNYRDDEIVDLIRNYNQTGQTYSY